jgi:hypothetical protein
MRYLFFIGCVLLGISAVHGQAPAQPKYIQFSGIVLTHDSLKAVSYATIWIVGTNKRTSADGEGFFNFVAREGDSIQFSAIGYRKVYTVIPRDLNTNKYSWIQLMREDTFYLAETIIKPWPSKEEIDRYLATGTVDPAYQQALTNTEKQKLDRLQQTMPLDARENQRAMLNYQQAKYYYSGQAPPIRVLDPFAWASFFKAWKDGQFKQK